MGITVELLEKMVVSEVENLHLRIDELSGRFDILEARFDSVQLRLDSIDRRLDNFLTKEDAKTMFENMFNELKQHFTTLLTS